MTAASASRVLGANERVRVGLIGCGGRCLHDAKHMRNSGGVEFPAVCDVYEKRAAKGKQFAGGDCDTYSDFRRLLDRKDLDAVLINLVGTEAEFRYHKFIDEDDTPYSDQWVLTAEDQKFGDYWFPESDLEILQEKHPY